MSVRVLCGDVLDKLAELPDESVHACVTSPPYFGLRDYGVDGQIGLEATPAEYIEKMVAVSREVRRVLRSDGVCFLNLGDSYAGSWGAQGRSGAMSGRSVISARQIAEHPRKDSGTGSIPPDSALKPKDLMLMPERVAIALQADGWWVRSRIIWSKPNPMPESITDRPTSAHEHVWLLAKSARYFWDAEAVREVATVQSWDDGSRVFGGVNKHGSNVPHGERTTGRRASPTTQRVKIPGGWDRGEGGHGTIHRDGRTSAEYQEAETKAGRNLRNVWEIATEAFPEAHFATFPTRLAERCIKASTSEFGCCPECGAPWRRSVAKGEPDLEWQRRCGGDADGAYSGSSTKDHATAGVQDASAVKARILEGMRKRLTTGWEQTCSCAPATPVSAVVLDPFGGSGTTGMVADRLGRDAVLIELNPEYAAMAERRIARDRLDRGAGGMADVKTARLDALPMDGLWG